MSTVGERRLFAGELGYGIMLEIPSPIYGQALAMGLVWPVPRECWRVLQDGDDDLNLNYARCSRADAKLHAYRVDQQTAEKRNMEFPEFIRLQEAKRAIPFLRGRIRLEPTKYEEDGYLTRMARIAYHDYIERLYRQVMRYHRWDLTFEKWHDEMKDGEYCNTVTLVRDSGLLTFSIEEHKRLIPQMNRTPE